MNISGTRVGTRINFFLEDGLQSKDFHSDEIADKAFKALLVAKADPTKENIDKLYEFLNKNIRIAKAGGFEYDPETDNIYLEGFNTPVPEMLMETIESYVENDYPLESITNFWKLLMANPDVRVRDDLFEFIAKHNFVLTDKGYMIVYKTVAVMNDIEQDIASFVSNSYIKVRKDWGTSAGRYVVYKKFNLSEDDVVVKYTLELTKKTTFEKWNLDKKNVELVGNLGELQKNLDKLIDGNNSTIFTDLHTKKTKIRLGEAVVMERSECDGDPKQSCSYGLHVGSTGYVEKFAGWKNSTTVLHCLVNPMHVVAVPESDTSKMRVSEYFPFALGNIEVDENDSYSRKIDIISQPFFEYDYVAHEEAELTRMLKANELDRQNSINASLDNRTEEEYKAILEARVIDLSK